MLPPPRQTAARSHRCLCRSVVAAHAFCGVFYFKKKKPTLFRVSVCVHARRPLGRPVDLFLFFFVFFVRAIETRDRDAASTQRDSLVRHCLGDFGLESRL
nr:hypothetical protein [Pandoravirus belohorizontensis]